MKFLGIIGLLLGTSVAAQAVVQDLKCESLNKDAIIEIHFAHAFDPLNPWIGRNSFEGTLVAKPLWSREIYETQMTLSSMSGKNTDTSIRGDGHSEWVYLQLVPVFKGTQFTGRYEGELFINDVVKRAYLDFRGTSSEPGLTCR